MKSDRPVSQSNDSRGVALQDETVGVVSLRPTLVRASAGTGKTYQLTARLMKILFQGAPVESILATTFTRKAAGEILGRVLLTLARAADENDEQALRDLRDQVGIPSLSHLACRQRLHHVMRNIYRLRICTLDSLFSQLARSFPFELGLPPAWRLTDEIEEVWIRQRAVDAVIDSLEPSETMTLLAMLGKGEVRRSITRELLQVVDGTYSISRQCDADVWNKLSVPKRPESADLTAAAGQLRNADLPQKSLRNKLQDVADLMDARQFDVLVDDTLLINIARARRERSEVKFGRSKFPDSLNEAFDILYAAVRTEALSLLHAQNDATGQVIASYDFHVNQMKQSSRMLGFEDVAVRLANQFSRLDQAVLGKRMDGAIDHVLLDEFQDTSPIQWQVLRPFATQAVSSAVVKHDETLLQTQSSFFCVGDTKQAIYGWRGGVAEIFETVTDQIEGIKEEERNVSFRSSPVVLAAVDRVFKNLRRHPMASVADPKNLADKSVFEAEALSKFANNFPTHEAKHQDLPGYVSLCTSARVDGDADADAKRSACYDHAARLIAKLNAEAPSQSIGVLTRTNRGVAQMIYLLDSMGIEVSQEGGNPLTDSAAVEVVLSALMMAEHPGDGRWEFHVSSTTLAEHLPENGGDFIRSMIENQGLSETVEFLADGLAGVCDARDTQRLRQLVYLAMMYQPNAAPRLRDFVRLVREKRIERPQAAPVRVMTVHQAKGLEFDAVVLPELDGNLVRSTGKCVIESKQLDQPPTAICRSLNHKSWHFLSASWRRAFGDQVRAANTEALCLLYVAMTRAKQALYIVIQPATKQVFENKAAASLIYHSLQCDRDPTIGESLLFESGDADWHQNVASVSARPGTADAAGPTVEISFQPLPPVPRRNRASCKAAQVT